jgi:hypothetical protein
VLPDSFYRQDCLAAEVAIIIPNVLVSIASTEHSSHRHRPTGPVSPSGVPLLVPKQAAVAASLVAAPGLPGEVPASDQSTVNKHKQIYHYHVATGAAVTCSDPHRITLHRHGITVQCILCDVNSAPNTCTSL